MTPNLDFPPAPPAPVTFANPPVAEVALSVQFSGPVLDGNTVTRDLLPVLCKSFPKTEILSAVPRMGEEFSPNANPGLSFQIVGQGPEFRFWFISEDDVELVQVQADRLTFNWRRENDSSYPRYEKVRQRFIETCTTFVDVLSGSEAEPRVDWCEVSYLNPLPVRNEDGSRKELSTMLTRFSRQDLTCVGHPEDVSLHERFLLLRDAMPIGRLIVNLSPVLLGGNSPQESNLLRLTARGLAPEPNLRGAVSFLDYGREIIVTTFRDITTAEMHEQWGLQQ